MVVDKEAFYIAQEEPNRSCYLALREILLKFDARISETVKYGWPCFLLEGKILCYLGKKKKENVPYILFSKGDKMRHPQLVLGDRKKMKHLSIPADKDIPMPLLLEVLTEAVSCY